MAVTATLPFGPLLRRLRKQAGMTQGDLAAALGYSVSLICALEKGQRQPDVQLVAQRFIPALGLQDEAHAAAALIEQAALARGERLPASITLQRTVRLSIEEEAADQVRPLPSPPAELFGRAAELNQLGNRLLGHSGRLLTLVGPPGIGKTTLALAVAARLQGHFTDGVAFVSLAAVEDEEVMASTVAVAVSAHATGPKSPPTRLIEFLRRKHMLLILDNLEQITRAASLVARLVAECPDLCILATSRERLHLRAEQRWQVQPLDLASAVELFSQRAVAVNRDFHRSPQNQPLLEELCRRLDCLPLALELCAAQADLLSPTQLLAQVQERPLDLLVDGAHDLPPRQRTLDAAIRHSYALLKPEERALLRRLGIFAGGFEVQAAQALGGTVVGLRSLASKNLLRMATPAGSEPRFLMLATIREFALEQLRAEGEETDARQRHFATYLQLFRSGDHQLRAPEMAAALARLIPEQDNLRAALQWALTTGHYAGAAWLLVVASYFWNLAGFAYEEARWLGQVLPHRQALDPELRLALLLTFYRAAFAVPEFHPLEPYMCEITQLLEHCSHPLLHATAWAFQASTAPDVAQAITIMDRAITLARAAQAGPALSPHYGAISDAHFNLAAHLCGYAALLIDQGQAVRAAAIAAESLQLFRAHGNRAGIGDCLGNLGRAALLRGDLEQAGKFLREAATIALSLHYVATQYEWQALLARVTLYAGDMEAARQMLNESLRRCREQKSTILLAQVCACLAEVALWEGDHEEAERWLALSIGDQAVPRQITIFQLEQIAIAARLAAVQRHHAAAAALFGLVDAVSSSLQCTISGPQHAPLAAARAAVQEALGPITFAEMLTAGQQLSLEEVFAALSATEWVSG